MKLWFAILLCPAFISAQNTLPRFENDTLYTSSGYKIYKGQTLQFGEPTGKNGLFRFILFQNDINSNSLKNASVVVKELKNFEKASFFNGYGIYEISAYGNFHIQITGTINYKDGSKGHIDIKMEFDKAIENSPGLPSELVVPAEFRSKGKRTISEEISKLFTIYKNGVLSKEAYEAQKKKLLFTFPLTPPDQTLQYILPRFEKDTLYTTCGYKIYKGQTLQFGKGTGHQGRFRYINIKNGIPADSLTNNSFVVKKIKNFGISSIGNGYIEIVSPLIYKDGSKGHIDVHMAFDYAIENSLELPGELIVPDEYRNKPEVSIARDITKLNVLVREGALSPEEFEAQKKKMLQKQKFP